VIRLEVSHAEADVVVEALRAWGKGATDEETTEIAFHVADYVADAGEDR
jgi:hypothetical protein